MAYVTGTANSMSDLLAALQTACTNNGWTLSGNVLSKGPCYVSVTTSGTDLLIRGGTGKDGSNALTGAATQDARLGKMWTYAPADTMTFPVSYEVFVQPAEVYLVIHYEVDRYQWMAFGTSPVTGLPGTGNWFGASAPLTPADSALLLSITPTVGGYSSACAGSAALFWTSRTDTTAKNINAQFHHGLAGSGWSLNFNSSTYADCEAISAASTAVSRQPNAFNAETVLVPIQVFLSMPGSKQSMVGDIAGARYLRNDNLSPGEIITLGADRWKVYPWHRKNLANRNGDYGYSNQKHTGTMGWAIRYDGP